MGRIDYVRPLLLIFGLERSEELVERLVALGHGPHAGVEGFARRRLLALDEPLQFLYLCYSFRATRCLLAPWMLLVGKVKLLVLLEPILVSF